MRIPKIEPIDTSNELLTKPQSIPEVLNVKRIDKQHTMFTSAIYSEKSTVRKLPLCPFEISEPYTTSDFHVPYQHENHMNPQSILSCAQPLPQHMSPSEFYPPPPSLHPHANLFPPYFNPPPHLIPPPPNMPPPYPPLPNLMPAPQFRVSPHHLHHNSPNLIHQISPPTTSHSHFMPTAQNNGLRTNEIKSEPHFYQHEEVSEYYSNNEIPVSNTTILYFYF